MSIDLYSSTTAEECQVLTSILRFVLFEVGPEQRTEEDLLVHQTVVDCLDSKQVLVDYLLMVRTDRPVLGHNFLTKLDLLEEQIWMAPGRCFQTEPMVVVVVLSCHPQLILKRFDQETNPTCSAGRLLLPVFRTG